MRTESKARGLLPNNGKMKKKKDLNSVLTMPSVAVKESQAAHTCPAVCRTCKQPVHECPVKTPEPFECEATTVRSTEVLEAATAARATLPQLEHIKRLFDCSA